MAKKYFPNSIDAVMETEYDEVPAEQVFERLHLWDIPSSVCCLIRAEHKETGKISEFSYTSPYHAGMRIKKLAENDDHNIIMANEEAVFMLAAVPLKDYFDWTKDVDVY